MKLKVLKIILTIVLITNSCKSKKQVVTDTVKIPQKVLTTPEIKISTLFRNDSLVFIDTNKVVVILKRDTINKTIQVKAKCPEEKVVVKKEIVEKPVYKNNIFFLILTAVIFYLIGLTFKNLKKWH